MFVTPEHIRGARALLGLTQAEVARRAGISTTAFNGIERGIVDPKASTLVAIQHVFEAAGIIFFDDDGPGVQLRAKKPQRRSK